MPKTWGPSAFSHLNTKQQQFIDAAAAVVPRTTLAHPDIEASYSYCHDCVGSTTLLHTPQWSTDHLILQRLLARLTAQDDYLTEVRNSNAPDLPHVHTDLRARHGPTPTPTPTVTPTPSRMPPQPQPQRPRPSCFLYSSFGTRSSPMGGNSAMTTCGT